MLQFVVAGLLMNYLYDQVILDDMSGGSPVAKIQSLIDDNQSSDLDLTDHDITTEILNQLEFPDGLQVLWLSDNQITSLDGVYFPDSLQELWLSGNQITSLDGVNFPDGLQELWLYDNQITSLNGVKFPYGLQELVYINWGCMVTELSHLTG
jgi:internalin A